METKLMPCVTVRDKIERLCRNERGAFQGPFQTLI